MIAHLTGNLLTKHATSVIIDTNGVGYEVTIPVSTFFDIGEAGAKVSLLIYTHVREDALQLYGFRTGRERELFLLLIGITGIGPKLAITMLSGMNADEIITAIRTNNLIRLTSIPGVGKKTAERLVIELRDKMTNLSSPAMDEALATGATPQPSEDLMRSDTLSALINLGYQKAAAEKAITQAMQESGDQITIDAILRRALRLLSKG
ncbi:MAG: Holliday junction branch migration protein RuvA [Pyrinomonadaceae bacterium MAG19_C2-C3]|nr:Holliday junction branch migration protein RuvA [Pyrinomonadaceae bacterium MAG19_C2-C3]